MVTFALAMGLRDQLDRVRDAMAAALWSAVHTASVEPGWPGAAFGGAGTQVASRVVLGNQCVVAIAGALARGTGWGVGGRRRRGYRPCPLCSGSLPVEGNTRFTVRTLPHF